MPAVTTFDALLSGMTWNGLGVSGRPVFLTYSFDAAPATGLSMSFSAGFLSTFQPLSGAEQDLARGALHAWADSSGITFFEVPAGQGDLRFGEYDLSRGPPDVEDSVGFALNPLVYAYPNGAVEIGLGGDIFLDAGQIDFEVLAHEIGHALGLKHPFEGELTLARAVDDVSHTVMSYNMQAGAAAGLGELDRQAIAYLYGPATADGTQAAGWSWDAQHTTLTQVGGPGGDTLAGVATADRVQAGGGADYVFTRGGDDSVSGGDGDDTVAGGDGADTIIGGTGADALGGDDGDDLVQGGDGADQLWGAAGADTLAGEAGDDTLIGGGSGTRDADRLLGGEGDDVMVIATGGAVVDGGEGNDQLWLNPGGAESVRLSYATITAGGGSYAGVERMVFFGATAADTLQGGELPDQLVGGAGGDSLAGFASDDQLFGEDGGDTLAGGEGADRLDGGAGDDLLLPGEGADTLIGGDGSDTVDFSAELEALRLVINTPRAASGLGTEQMFSVENIVGTRFGDSISGDAGANRLFGGEGGDTIAGGEGANYVRGDEGDDSLTGGAGFDDINGNAGADTISTGAGDDWCVGGKDGDRLFGDDGADLVYGNLGDDTCDGGAGADTLRGGQDNDSLTGGAGADFLSGDRGDDTMAGGSGADIFHSFADAGLDRIVDFSVADGDRLMLDPGTMFTLSQVGADTVVTMLGGGQVVLAGVALGSLAPGWIFGG